MPGIMGGIKALNPDASFTAGRIAIGHLHIVHQKLPAAVKPEFQHIRRARYGMGAAAALVSCADGCIVGTPLGAVIFE
ncbi:hypothetical protein D3C81_1877900 [compost metagenome]